VIVHVNGDRVELPETASVSVAVDAAGAGGRTRGLAVAVDGEVVPRSGWEETRLTEGQSVEVVEAIQGG
jgi:sulfur carrier protein